MFYLVFSSWIVLILDNSLSKFSILIKLWSKKKVKIRTIKISNRSLYKGTKQNLKWRVWEATTVLSERTLLLERQEVIKATNKFWKNLSYPNKWIK